MKSQLCTWLFAVLLLSGCSVPIASNLEESDANLAVVALEKSGISAAKERDPDAEGHFRVLVSRDDAASSAAVLTQDNLPARATPGVLDAVAQGSMVPSRMAEHARLVAGTSGNLERSLRAVDGVVSARVHLAVPELDPLALNETQTHATASVLVRHRGATPPLAIADIQRLVAGAVPGLAPDEVSVVMAPAPGSLRSLDRGLSQFGPIAVTRSSLTPLRIMVGVIVAVNAALIGLLLMLWSRLRRTELALIDVKGNAESSAKKS